MTDVSGGPLDVPTLELDVPTLEVMGRRASTHQLVSGWEFRPDEFSPRLLLVRLDADQYPEPVDAARLDVRWFENGDYSLHHLESRDDGTWQCRWDRHDKPGAPLAHVHPPPDASVAVEPSDVDADHHLGVLFAVLDWIEERVEAVYGD